MSYKEALEAAGATVHAMENFGSYQGDWLAKVTYGCDSNDGELEFFHRPEHAVC